MDIEKLKKLATDARATGWYVKQDIGYNNSLHASGGAPDYKFIIAASPDVVLELIDANQELWEALKFAYEYMPISVDIRRRVWRAIERNSKLRHKGTL